MESLDRINTFDIRILDEYFEYIVDINEGVAFAVLAGKNLETWNFLTDVPVTHKIIGEGVVNRIRIGQESQIFIEIEFTDLPEDSKYKKFLPDAFFRGFFSCVGLQQKKPQWLILKQQLIKKITTRINFIKILGKDKISKGEDEAIFAYLRKKYRSNSYEDHSPLSNLYRILIMLEEHEELGEEDLNWLENRKLFCPLAVHYERLALDEEEPSWNLPKASSYWRKAGYPNRALTITAGKESYDKKLLSAIKTSRGGAFRDLKMLQDALCLAGEAIELSPRDYYAYNLMGALYYQTGEPLRGDEFFDKAIKLGSSVQETKVYMEGALRQADREEQLKTAQYLLEKDPTKYAWVRRYLYSIKFGSVDYP